MVFKNKLIASGAMLCTVALGAALCVPAANAASSQQQNFTASVRSFPVAAPPNPLTESYSVEVSQDVSWNASENGFSVKDISQKAPAEKQPQALRQQSKSVAPSGEVSTPFIPAPPMAQNGNAVAQYALQFVGKVPYRYGGTTPAGWDCSGFTAYVFRHFGVNLPHSSSEQGRYGVPVPASAAQPGDLMVTPSGGHVGIYIGNGMMVHAGTPRTGTCIAPITWSSFRYYRIVK